MLTRVLFGLGVGLLALSGATMLIAPQLSGPRVVSVSGRVSGLLGDALVPALLTQVPASTSSASAPAVPSPDPELLAQLRATLEAPRVSSPTPARPAIPVAPTQAPPPAPPPAAQQQATAAAAIQATAQAAAAATVGSAAASAGAQSTATAALPQAPAPTQAPTSTSQPAAGSTGPTTAPTAPAVTATLRPPAAPAQPTATPAGASAEASTATARAELTARARQTVDAVTTAVHATVAVEFALTATAAAQTTAQARSAQAAASATAVALAQRASAEQTVTASARLAAAVAATVQADAAARAEAAASSTALAAVPTPAPTAVPTEIPSTPTPRSLRVEAEWPERLSLPETDYVRISLVRTSSESRVPTIEVRGHLGLLATVVPVGTPEAPLDAAFGEEYDAYARAYLDALGFETRLSGQEERAVDQEQITWDWNLRAQSIGKHVLNVRVDVQWRSRSGTAAHPPREIWRAALPVEVVPPQPPAVRSFVSDVGMASGLLGTVLSTPGAVKWLRRRRHAIFGHRVHGVTPVSVGGTNAWVFLSHVHEDAAVATTIARALENRGLRSWLYERDNTVPGWSYVEAVIEALGSCSAVVLVVSEHAIGRPQVDAEVIRAFELGKRILPVLVDLSHREFQERAPSWVAMTRGAISVSASRDAVDEACAKVIAGLASVGITPRAPDPGGVREEISR